MIGLLNINKPANWTSRDAVNRLQKLLAFKKIGHAGTLDPMATGVLVMLIGPATRLTEFVQRQRKFYRAGVRFGLTSTTDDIWGECQTVAAREFDRQELQSVVSQFVGQIQQVPPRVSAVKIAGKRAYQRARAGEQFEVKPRHVHVYSIEIVSFEYPNCVLQIECGSGTYIRSIARDIGAKLCSPAVMSSLERTRIGNFPVQHALDFESLQKQENARELLLENTLPTRQAISDIELIAIDESGISALEFGRKLALNSEQPELAVADQDGELLAVMSRCQNGLYRPRINFVPILRAG